VIWRRDFGIELFAAFARAKPCAAAIAAQPEAALFETRY
jgi:hypothetical protein